MFLFVCFCGFGSQMTLADEANDEAKPKAAFFPLAGDAKEDLREKVGFSLRSKLDRTGEYEVLDGYFMKDLVADVKEPISYDTPPEVVRELGESADAVVLVWGELSSSRDGPTLRLRILDLRETEPKPKDVVKVVAEATDLRFVSEEVIENLAGVEKHEHPTDVAVWDDAKSQELWKKNPNLVVNGDFSKAGKWDALYMAEKYPVEISNSLPEIDKVNIYRMPVDDGKVDETENVLAMNISRFCAENNGMACLSQSFKIKPDTRYRIKFRYKSDGPVLHVFVKGYTMFDNIKGEKTEREIYRRQVPVAGATDGHWVEIVDDLNPQHVAMPVQTLKVDLYAYLSPGVVMFDDVQVKAVGEQMRKATDKALDKPTTRPRGSK
jgi:hypothetical protein